jgi:hypothetical protein
MNRKSIIEKLLKEGFNGNTLSRLDDKSIFTLAKTVLKETVMVKSGSPTASADIANAKKQGKTIETYESKVCPVCEMKDCKCDDKKHKKNVSEVEEWVLNLTESKYSEFTSKKDIMNIISEKMETFQPMPGKAKKGHNGVPEFMTYDSIVAGGTETKPAPSPNQPDVSPDAPPREKPSKPKTPYQPGPGTNPKPKALAEKKKK